MSLSAEKTVDYARKILLDKTNYVQLQVTVRNMVLDALSETQREVYKYILRFSPCISSEISLKLNKSHSHICNILNQLGELRLIFSATDKKSGKKAYFLYDL